MFLPTPKCNVGLPLFTAKTVVRNQGHNVTLNVYLSFKLKNCGRFTQNPQ